MIKRTGVQMQQRQVPSATVTSWQHRVEKLEPQVRGGQAAYASDFRCMSNESWRQSLLGCVA